MRILDRLAGGDPPRLVCVDPRPTQVARRATVHLAPRVGTNLALLNALLHEVVRAGRVDTAYIAAHTVGFDELKARVAPCTPEWAEGVCDVPAARIREAAEILGTAPAAVDRAAGRPPVPPGDRGGRTGQQPAPDPGHAGPARCGRPADERAAHRPEHPGMRRQRRPARIPQLAERRARRRPGPGVERRPEDHPALRPSHARPPDVPLRRAGLAAHAVDQRHQSGRVPSRAVPHPLDPRPGTPLRRRPGPLPDRDRPTRRRRPARRDLGGRRPAPSPTPTGPCTSATRPSNPRARPDPTSTSSSTTSGAWTSATRTAHRSSPGTTPNPPSRRGNAAAPAARATTRA